MTTNSTLAIEATGLVRSFGETRAVDGVDLAVPVGSVYGVLGPNGAGKTTVIRMLATLLRPDAGRARVLGHDVVEEADAVRRVVSLTGQLASVDEDLTGRENLILLGRLLGMKRPGAKERASELLEAFGLAEAANRLVKHYSGGMRRRLDIAASLVVTPKVMFLDEPTTGLDPRSRNSVWAIIRALAGAGTTILLCTQYLEEADQLADGIAVIDRGKVIAEGTPGQLKASVGSGTLHVRLMDPAQLALVVTFSFGLSWVFTTLGLLMRSPSAVMNVGFMSIFPLTFLSNVFVDPKTLPGPVEAFVNVNPISTLATAARGLLKGNPDVGDILTVLAVAAAVTAVFAPITLRLYHKR